MQINVAQLLKEPTGATRDYSLKSTLDMAAYGPSCPVRGEIRLIRTHRGILAEGALQIELVLACSRCLKRYRLPVSLNLEEEYLPRVDVVNGTPLPPPEDPGDFTINENHILNLAEAIRQYALLAVPMKPLCRQDCGGLGTPEAPDTAGETAQDTAPATDPRWSRLNELLKK